MSAASFLCVHVRVCAASVEIFVRSVVVDASVQGLYLMVTGLLAIVRWFYSSP